MGEVHLARDETLGRNVAIKFVSVERRGDADAGRRLVREAQAAAALDHPSICAIHEAGETPDGRAFIVMQYVEGESLSAVLQRGPLPVRDAIALCVHIAEALATAHRHGVIHRDLKPSNVMITPSGRPKLLDFGIAKVVGAPAAVAEAPTSSEGTTGGTILGTPAYMSPEQVQQRPLDGRSDLFSLGVLLYECLTGRRLFQQANVFATIASVLHVAPPAPSTVRRDLTEQHDELCLRLLAKDPLDRFQTAEEVVGAAGMLLTDSARTTIDATRKPVADRGAQPWISGRSLAGLVAPAVLRFAGVRAWWATRTQPLPPVPAESDVWYRRGTEAIREGAYQTGRVALEEAIKVFPQHVLAYARVAEADAELDDQRSAQSRLLRVSSLVPNESRLPEIDRVRLQAVRTLVLRDVDASIGLYRRLLDLRPDDAGAWLDLGRAQEAAGLRTDARNSYEQAIARDRQYAAAYLRLGSVEALELRRESALKAFAEAERLYLASSNDEGIAEVLLRRGAMFDGFGDYKQARADLDRALRLTTDSRSAYQQVRARLSLSSVNASEGDFARAETMGLAAVQDALRAGLDTLAAEGLVDLAATLAQAGQMADAAEYARRALQLAEAQSAPRTGARARLQLASVYEVQAQAADALREVHAALPFLKENRYRRLELTALSIATRAHERLGALERARTMGREVLTVAETLKDEAQVALASANLASVITESGDYPEALRLRERAEEIQRRRGEHSSLAYALANRAELLIKLGRMDDAQAPLAQIDAGIAAGSAPYVTRVRRVAFLRSLAAAAALRCDEALRAWAPLRTNAESDSTAMMARGLEAFCTAHLRRATPPVALAEDVNAFVARELHYWFGAAALGRDDARRALDEASRGLTLLGDGRNDELRWRLAAVGAAAARQLGDAPATAQLRSLARDALERLRSEWKVAFGAYEKRPDLVDLRRRAGQL